MLRSVIRRGRGWPGAALLLATYVVVALPSAASPAAGATSVTVTQDGWWGAGPGVPGSVPESALAVGARLGEADKVAALGIVLRLAPGEALDRLVLTLRRSSDPRATLDPAGAARLVACPIVSAWRGARSGDLTAAPQHDCNTARAVGAAGADGNWRFDLTTIARTWVGTLPQHGVLLREDVEPPVTFQVAFDDASNRGVSLTAETAPVSLSRGTPTGEAARAPAATGRGSSVDARFGPALAGSMPLDGAPGDPLSAPSPGTPGTPATAGATPGTAPATGVGGTSRVGGVGLLSNLPGSAALLVPVLLGFAVLACYTLGPAGDAAARRPRQGALSRAMASPGVGAEARRAAR